MIRSPWLRLEFVHEFGDVATLTPPCAWRFDDFERGQAWGDIDAKIGRLENFKRLLLAFIMLAACVACFVKAQVAEMTAGRLNSSVSSRCRFRG